MKSNKLYLLILMLCNSIFVNAQVPFTAGNIVVYRVGTGSVSLTDNTHPVFLDEFTPAGVLVQSIALPTTYNSGNNEFTCPGGSPTHGMLNLSSDGRYLIAVGYAAVVGTPGASSNDANTTPRVIGLVNYNAQINTTTALTDFTHNAPGLSATSTNGTDLWAAGSNDGVRYTTVGSTTSVQLTTTPTTLRVVSISAGQLYVSTGSTLRKVGNGLPTTAGQTADPLTNLPAGGIRMEYEFFDLNPAIAGNDVLYIADEGSGGLRKYSYDGTNWILNGTIGNTADDYRGLTAIVTGTTVKLFATRIGTNNALYGGGEIITLTDATGHGGAFVGTPTTFSSIATRFGIADVASYRGLALVPQNSTMPVKMVAFSARWASQDVVLNWSTTNETNFSHFMVERSHNGLNFESIGQVNRDNSSTSIKKYSYTDAKPASTTTLWYRLKMVDKDGNFEYSNIQLLTKKSGGSKVSIIPNPCTKMSNLVINVSNSTSANISISDMSGKKVLALNNIVLLSGENTIPIKGLDNLSKGLYSVHVAMSGVVITNKLIKL